VSVPGAGETSTDVPASWALWCKVAGRQAGALRFDDTVRPRVPEEPQPPSASAVIPAAAIQATAPKRRRAVVLHVSARVLGAGIVFGLLWWEGRQPNPDARSEQAGREPSC